MRRYDTLLGVECYQGVVVEHLVRRFRKEIRLREDIQPKSVVTLQDDRRRARNVQAAQLLLKEVFGKQITVQLASKGLVCASREEAAISRLQEYTRMEVKHEDLFLTSLTLAELAEFLESKGEASEGLFLAQSPEQRFVSRLGEEFPDVLYGL